MHPPPAAPPCHGPPALSLRAPLPFLPGAVFTATASPGGILDLDLDREPGGVAVGFAASGPPALINPGPVTQASDAGRLPAAAHLNMLITWLSTEFQTPAPPLDIRGTPFQLAVWSRLMMIPPGQTRSYSQIAAELGVPGAARAVARACAANRIALLIPCHRVTGADGGLCGYRWGLLLKEKILAFERNLSRSSAALRHAASNAFAKQPAPA